MTATNKHSGRAILSERERFRQAIADIITTPVGTRVLVGEYGCHAYRFIDYPAVPVTFQKIRASIIHAIRKWEPAAASIRVQISRTSGRYKATIYSVFQGREEIIDGIEL